MSNGKEDPAPQEAGVDKCTPGGDNESHLFNGNLQVLIGRKENKHNHIHKTKLKSGKGFVNTKAKFKIAPRRG